MQCIKSIISNIRMSRVSPLIKQNVFNNTQWITSLRLCSTQDDIESGITFQTHFYRGLKSISSPKNETAIQKVFNIYVINKLCKGDKNLEKKLKILMLEVDVKRQDGRQAPSNLQLIHWERLLSLTSVNQRSRYLTYLWKTEMAKENEKSKKKAKREEFELNHGEDQKEYPDDLRYGLKYQSMFLRIRDSSINQFDNYRALQSMVRGQSLVIDCSYDQQMSWREAINAAKQMTLVFGCNRIHREPFNIHMCNVNHHGEFMKQLRINIPSIEEPWMPLNIHTQSYLNMFPKQNLVYLTPHCREELTNFDHDAVYIIGCMVDKGNNEPLSLAKAKRDGLKMAKLPLDRYLYWAPGAKKNLNINHMVEILLDLKFTGDWDHALRHVPKRKLMETKILAMQNKIRNSKLVEEEAFKNLKIGGKKTNTMSFRAKRYKSHQSLYDDE